MIQAFLIKPYVSLEPIVQIPLISPGITGLKFAGDMQESFLLEMKINQNLGQLFFDIKDNENVGIRIRQIIKGVVEWDLAFVKSEQDQEDVQLGESRIKFRTIDAWLSDFTVRDISYYTAYNKTPARTVIGAITTDFNWNFIGTNPAISLTTGELNCRELLDEAVKTVGNWTWYPGSVSGNIPTVVVGDISESPIKGYAKEFEFDDPTDTDTIRIIETPTVRYNGKVETHILASGSISSATGADENSKIFLDTGVSTIAGFPLVDLGERTTSGKILYRIVNTEALSQLGHIVLGDEIVDFSNNIVDENGVPLVNMSAARQSVYNQAVARIRRQKYYQSFDFRFVFPKVFLPGSKILVNYNGIAKSVEGKEMKLQLNNYITYLRNVEYDLLQYVE